MATVGAVTAAGEAMMTNTMVMGVTITKKIVSESGSKKIGIASGSVTESARKSAAAKKNDDARKRKSGSAD
jgi:hypothetical protein